MPHSSQVRTTGTSTKGVEIDAGETALQDGRHEFGPQPAVPLYTGSRCVDRLRVRHWRLVPRLELKTKKIAQSP